MDARTKRVCDDVGRDLATLTACNWPDDHVDFVLARVADRLDAERERRVVEAAKARCAAVQTVAVPVEVDTPVVVSVDVGVLDRAG